MPIALNPKQTYFYVLDCDRSLPENEQTKFEIRGLTVAEEASVSDSMILAHSGGDDFSFRAGTHQLTVLRLGLRGWANFRDGEGQEVPFEMTKSHPRQVSDASLDRLAPEWRVEIMNAILDRGAVTEEEGN